MTACTCKSGIDKRGREWIHLCATHQAETDQRHQAAVESCSDVYRNSQTAMEASS